jgi:hypothetical protein
MLELNLENIVTTMAPSIIGGFAVWKISLKLYTHFAPVKWVIKGLEEPCYLAGRKIGKKLAKIPDSELRNKMAADFDRLGDKVDEFWDKGIQDGLKDVLPY